MFVILFFPSTTCHTRLLLYDYDWFRCSYSHLLLHFTTHRRVALFIKLSICTEEHRHMVRASRINSKMLMQQIILCSFINSNMCQSLCSRVQRFGQASGVVEAVGRISNSIGYSGISGVAKELLINSTDDSCRIKLAAMQNRAGEIVQPSINSAQSAVRSRANALLFQSTCPGFGMCADVLDADDYDVWPITAMTVSQTD